MTVAGFPATMQLWATGFTTTALAPTIAAAPMLTPGPTNASAQIHALSSMVIFDLISGKSDFR
jgi:hypothetical protein